MTAIFTAISASTTTSHCLHSPPSKPTAAPATFTPKLYRVPSLRTLAREIYRCRTQPAPFGSIPVPAPSAPTTSTEAHHCVPVLETLNYNRVHLEILAPTPAAVPSASTASPEALTPPLALETLKQRAESPLTGAPALAPVLSASHSVTALASTSMPPPAPAPFRHRNRLQAAAPPTHIIYTAQQTVEARHCTFAPAQETSRSTRKYRYIHRT